MVASLFYVVSIIKIDIGLMQNSAATLLSHFSIMVNAT